MMSSLDNGDWFDRVLDCLLDLRVLAVLTVSATAGIAVLLALS